MTMITNFVGFTKKTDLPRLGSSDSVNMFVDTLDANEHAYTRVLRPFPGYKKLADISGKPQGMYRVNKGHDGNPAVYGVWGGQVYLITGDTATPIHAIIGQGKVTFAESTGYGTNHPHLFICDGVNLYSVPTDESVNNQRNQFFTIAMPTKYNGTTQVVPAWVSYANGYILMGDKDTDIFYVSYRYPYERATNPNDIFDLANTENFGYYMMSEFKPDNTIIGATIKDRLFTFGKQTMQAWNYDGSLSINAPFTSPSANCFEIGIASKDSFASFGDTAFFLGAGDEGDNTIYAIQNGSPVRVSTDEIEGILAKSDKSGAVGYCFKYRSHVFYVLNLIASKNTLVYDATEGGWVRLSSRLANTTQGSYRYFYPMLNGKMYMQTEGALVEMTEDKWDEHDSTPILRKRTGNAITINHSDFKVTNVKLTTSTDYGLEPNIYRKISMRYTKDGVTWSDPVIGYLGQVGNTCGETRFGCLGKCKNFTIEISCSENIPFSIYALDIKGRECN